MDDAANTSLPQPFKRRIAYYRERVYRQLDAALPSTDTRPERLHDAMRYAVFNGGKRIRPLLVYAAGECLGVAPKRLDVPAAAIELIHAFSLVHDDLPAMDDDELRRGKPTLHIQYDEATAILAADALQPLAFSVVASMDSVGDDVKLQLISLLADACGSIGMTGGQSIDLGSEGLSLSADAVEHMYSLKTGALIRASIVSACILSQGVAEESLQAMHTFARLIGITFQIRDDILDVEGETEIIGKPNGSDEDLRKATYPRLFGLERSRRRCDDLLGECMQQLALIGDDAEPLRWLAEYVVSRRA